MNETQIMVLELGGKGYSCAQIIICGALRLQGKSNPDLVRAMSGLGQGVGGSGNICGALAGGVCMLAMYTAKGQDTELPTENSLLLQDELVNWFQSECCADGPVTCDSILKIDSPLNRIMRSETCGVLVAKVWEKTISILLSHDIDPRSGRAE